LAGPSESKVIIGNSISAFHRNSDGEARPSWKGQAALRRPRAAPSRLLPQVAGARQGALPASRRAQHRRPHGRRQGPGRWPPCGPGGSGGTRRCAPRRRPARSSGSPTVGSLAHDG
jgi:hypothetical protein